MKKLVIIDPDGQCLLLTADSWDGERLVVDGVECPYLGTDWLKHSRAPGGRILGYKYADPAGNEFHVLGENSKVRFQ